MKTITCIGCPLGCSLDIEIIETEEGPQILDIRGYECNRGRIYAQDEIISPKRMLTTLIPLQETRRPLSVRSEKPLPKDLIFAALAKIHCLQPQLPVAIGDCILSNILDTGIDIIATCTLDIDD